MKNFLTSDRSKFPLVHNTIEKIESTVFRIAYWSAPIFSQKSSRLYAGTHGNSLSKRTVSIEKEYEEHSGGSTLTWEHGVNTYSSSSTARCWFEMVFQRIVSGRCCCLPTPPPAEPRLCTPPLQSNCRQTESSVRPAHIHGAPRIRARKVWPLWSIKAHVTQPSVESCSRGCTLNGAGGKTL